MFTVKRCDFDRFYSETYRVRRDFDKIYRPDADPKEVEAMLEKYELYIEQHFEPYAAMHECRTHSNLWGKMVLWGDKALETDHIGFYKPVKLFGTPSDGNYHEEYPHMVTAWVYDHQYLDASFNYDELEAQYMKKEAKSGESPMDAKAALDAAHKQ